MAPLVLAASLINTAKQPPAWEGQQLQHVSCSLKGLLVWGPILWSLLLCGYKKDMQTYRREHRGGGGGAGAALDDTPFGSLKKGGGGSRPTYPNIYTE